MFGSGAVVGFGSSNISSEPLTNDIAANEFALKAGLTIEVEQQLRTLDMPVRLKVLTVLDAKMRRHPVQNPSMYLAGIIRNENRAGPYKAFGAPAQAVLEPFQGKRPAAEGDAIASAQPACPHKTSALGVGGLCVCNETLPFLEEDDGRFGSREYVFDQASSSRGAGVPPHDVAGVAFGMGGSTRVLQELAQPLPKPFSSGASAIPTVSVVRAASARCIKREAGICVLKTCPLCTARWTVQTAPGNTRSLFAQRTTRRGGL